MGDARKKYCRDKSQLQEIVAVAVIVKTLKSQFTWWKQRRTSQTLFPFGEKIGAQRHEKAAGARIMLLITVVVDATGKAHGGACYDFSWVRRSNKRFKFFKICNSIRGDKEIYIFFFSLIIHTFVQLDPERWMYSAVL